MKKLKILVIPTNYPSDRNPIAGIFIKEFAKAISKNNSVKILYSYPTHPLDVFGILYTYRVIKNFEDNIEVVKIEYSGIFSRILKKLDFAITRKIRDNRDKIKKSRENKLFNRVNKLITYINQIPTLFGIILGFRRLLKEGWKPDIIHAHGFYAGINAVLLGKLYHIPVVISEHWSGFPRRSLSWVDIIEAKFILKNATLILTPTHYLKKHIMSYGIYNNFCVVPNPINFDIFYPKLFQQKRSMHRRLLFVGRIIPEKGLVYLIYSLKKIIQRRQDILLEIIGDGPYREEYEKLARYLNIAKFIKFLGVKPQKDVAKYMRNAHIYVQPTTWETFGVTFFESLACGTPVVATNIPALEENIKKTLGILVPPEDIESLEKAIEYMLDNYKRYPPKKLSAYIKSKCSYEAIAKKTEKIYQDIMNMTDTEKHV